MACEVGGQWRKPRPPPAASASAGGAGARRGHVNLAPASALSEKTLRGRNTRGPRMPYTPPSSLITPVKETQVRVILTMHLFT